IGAGRYNLLHRPDVQEELGLDRDQRDALGRIQRRWHDLFRESDRLDADEYERRRLALAQSQETEFARILSLPQLRRFQEIAVQDLDHLAFTEPAVIRTLQLTPDQEKHVRTI